MYPEIRITIKTYKPFAHSSFIIIILDSACLFFLYSSNNFLEKLLQLHIKSNDTLEKHIDT